MASTVLALGLAWANVEAPEAQAGFELPYKVGGAVKPAFLGIPIVSQLVERHRAQVFW